MPLISVTLDVLKLDRLRLVRLDIPNNILFISTTWDVSKLDRSRLVRLDI